MAIERLTASDLLMLWPDERWPQDIGALVILDGATLLDSDGRFRIDTVRELVARRLHLAPRFRQVLCVPPKALGGPLWVDAPSMDLASHVAAMPLPPPCDDAEMLLAVERLRHRRLNRSRPLWEMWFLTGLPEQRVGLFVRMHHSIADGIAGVAAMAAFLDATADAVHAPAPPWNPAPAPTAGELRGDYQRELAHQRRQRLSTLAHPVTAAGRVRTAWPAVRELFPDTGAAATSLDRVVGANRTFALVRSSFDLVKGVAHACDTKVNDVLLTSIAGGIRALLRSRGEANDVVFPVYVPITLRQGQLDQARGNQISEMAVPLPLGVSDPVQRLRLIAAETARLKALSHPSLGKLPHGGFVGRMFLKLLDRHRVNVTTADIPGPGMPLYFAGARLLEVFPLLPLIARVSLGVGALSYAGAFNIMAVADGETCPDLDVFAAGLEDELHALAVAAGVSSRRLEESQPSAVESRRPIAVQRS
jgi:diacylglycerol O-acyltransferase / wax synthase